MNNPADKSERSEYAPKSTRYTNQQNTPDSLKAKCREMGRAPFFRKGYVKSASVART